MDNLPPGYQITGGHSHPVGPVATNTLKGKDKAALGKALQPAVKTLDNAWSLTQRPMRAVRAAENHRDPVSALFHGVTPADAARDDAARYKWLESTQGGKPLSPVGRAAADVVDDPLAWIGVTLPGKVMQGRSLAGHALAKTEEHGFPAVVKAADRVAPTLNKSQTGQKVLATVTKAHDTLGVDAAAKRDLARTYGPKWLDEYAARWGIRNRSLSDQQELQRRLDQELESAFKGVPMADRGKVFGAIQQAYEKGDDASIRALPRNLRAVALKYRRVTDARAALQGDPGVREYVGARSKLPPSLAEFQSPEPRGLQKQSSFIEHYVASAPHNGEQELRDTLSALRGGKTDDLSTFNPNLLERTGEVIRDPAKIMEAERRANRNTARSVSAFDAGQRAKATGRLDDATAKMFERTYGDQLSPAGLMKTATDFDKAGIFVTPTRHMANITSLAAMADPAATLGAIGRTAFGAGKTLIGKGESAEQRFARLKPSIAAGAATAETGAKASPFWQQIERIPVAGKALGKVYHGSSRALWDYDNELADRVMWNKVAAGMSPERAALETREELVDYQNRSPFARGASTVVPFATWRTKAPLAAARLAARNPGRVSAAARAVPAAFGGSQPGPYGEMTSALPFSEAAGLLENPAGYARGSLGVVARGLGNLGLNRINEQLFKNNPVSKAKAKDWFTYGVPTAKYALQTAPLIGTGLDISANGLFDSPDRKRSIGQAVFESQTGFHQAFPKKPKSPRVKIQEMLLQRGVPWWQVDRMTNAILRGAR